MKNLILICIAIFAMVFTGCSNSSDEPTNHTFEEYGEYFASIANASDEWEGNEYLLLKATTYEWGTWEEAPEKGEYYGYDDEIWIEYFPEGYPMFLNNDGEEVWNKKPTIIISYGSGEIEITGGLSGPLSNIQFNVSNSQTVDWGYEELEEETMTGYFKSKKDFHFKRVEKYSDGDEYHQEATPR